MVLADLFVKVFAVWFGHWFRVSLNASHSNAKDCSGYVNDSKEGHGTFSWPDGRSYQGQWAEGKQSLGRS